jgi:two-component system, response regulator YesN
MYSVLIVDDEEPVLESYSYLVETALDDFEICGTARSGTEALAAAHQRRPDVVLMDIAMPGMDGLDTIREMQHEFPDTLYILSTAYERFDLAQRAIPLRVFAYLVKPVSRKRFMETLFRAKDHLDEERDRITHRLQRVHRGAEALAREMQNFMLLITWQPFDEATWTRYRELFHLPSDSGLVAAMELPDMDRRREVVERVERRHRCLSGVFMERLLLFISDGATREALTGYLERVLADLFGPDGKYALGVGTRRGYDELFRSCDEAFAALPAGTGDRQALAELADRSRHVLGACHRARDFAEVEHSYRAFSDFVFSTWPFPVGRSRVVVLFDRILREIGREIADPAAALSEMASPQEVDAWAQATLRRLLDDEARFGASGLPAALQLAVRYIDREYPHPIQLSDVAGNCGVSTGYLSRLFSEHLHQSFSDYLNAVRLDAAEEMLRSGDRTVKEIAYAVGYHDPNYFSRIFKRFRGFSPTRLAQER